MSDKRCGSDACQKNVHACVYARPGNGWVGCANISACQHKLPLDPSIVWNEPPQTVPESPRYAADVGFLAVSLMKRVCDAQKNEVNKHGLCIKIMEIAEEWRMVTRSLKTGLEWVS